MMDFASTSEDSILASLKTDGEKAWKKLHSTKKWKKESVLAVFASGKLPGAMKTGNGNWNRNAPYSIRNDRDILLARLAHENNWRNWDHPPFRIPRQFLDDKEVVLAVADRCPGALMRDPISSELLDDKDVLLAYVNSDSVKEIAKTHSPRFRDLLGMFSERIRGDADLMLKAARSLEQVFHHLSPSLLNNPSFAKKYAGAVEELPKNSLERFSEGVRANPKVVLAFVSRNGLCLKDVAGSLRGNYKIVREACDQNALALLHCGPGLTERHLGSDREFMLDVFERIRIPLWESPPQGNPKLYKMLSDNLKGDRELVVAAHRTGSFSISDMPPTLMRDREFWLDVIQRDSSLWLKLPDEYKTDSAFARIIRSFEDRVVVESVFTHLPILSGDRDIWKTIICDSNPATLDEDDLFTEASFLWLCDVIEKHAPEHIKQDRELMLYACRQHPRVLTLLALQWQEDREFVEAVTECSEFLSDLILPSISETAQLLYPDLAVKAIRKIDFEELDDLDADDLGLAESLWGRIDIATAYFECGRGFHDFFPAAMKKNREFGILVAKHDPEHFRLATTRALRGEKAFMMQAVTENGKVLQFARGGLRRDFDLAMVAFGGKNSVSFPVYRATNDDKAFFRKVLAKSLEKVTAHKRFTDDFLFGMSKNPGPDCSLSILATGQETSLALKKLIASFVGVPTGEELWLHRQVTQNLAMIEDLE